MKAGAFRAPPRREVQPGSRVLPTSQSSASSSTAAPSSRSELLSSWGSSSSRARGRARSSTLGVGGAASSRMPPESTAMSRARTLGLKRAPREESPSSSPSHSPSRSRSPSPPRRANRGRSQSFVASSAPARPTGRDSRRYNSEEEGSSEDDRRYSSRPASRARSHSRVRSRSRSPSPPRQLRSQSRPPSRAASRARSHSPSRRSPSPPSVRPIIEEAARPTSYFGSLWGKASQVLAAATGAAAPADEGESERAAERKGSLQRTQELGVPESSITPFELREQNDREETREENPLAAEVKAASGTLRHARTRPRPPPTAADSSSSLVSSTLLQKSISEPRSSPAPALIRQTSAPNPEPITWHRPPSLYPRDHTLLPQRRSTSPFDWLEPAARFPLDEFLFHRDPRRAATRMVKTRMLAMQRPQIPMGLGQQMWRQGPPPPPSAAWSVPPQPRFAPPQPPAQMQQQVQAHPHHQQRTSLEQQRPFQFQPPFPPQQPVGPPPPPIAHHPPPRAPLPPSFSYPQSMPSVVVSSAPIVASPPAMHIAQPPWPILHSAMPPQPIVATSPPLAPPPNASPLPSPPQPPVAPTSPMPPCSSPPTFASPPPIPPASPPAPLAVRSPPIPPSSPMPPHMRAVTPLSASPKPMQAAVVPSAVLDLPPSPPPPASLAIEGTAVEVVLATEEKAEQLAVASEMDLTAPAFESATVKEQEHAALAPPTLESTVEERAHGDEPTEVEELVESDEEEPQHALPPLELEWSLPDLGIGLGSDEPQSALVAPEAFFASLGLGTALEMEKVTLSASESEQLPLPVVQPFVEDEDEDDLEAAFAATASFVNNFREEQVPGLVDQNHGGRMQRWFEEQGVRAPSGMHEVMVPSEMGSLRPRTAPPASLSPPIPTPPIPSTPLVVQPLSISTIAEVVEPELPSPTGATVEVETDLASSASLTSPLVEIDPIFAGW